MNEPTARPVSGLRNLRSKADRMAEALEKGLRAEWLGVRPDLVLHPGADRMGGDKTYVLEDPVRGEHFELGESEARFFLCLVTEPDLKAAIRKLLQTTSLRPTIADILDFLKMLQKEQLAISAPETAIAGAALKEKKRPSKLAVAFRSYLFFKLPILRPQPILDVLYPWVRPLWSPPFLFLYGVLGVVGMAFAFQQLELYFHSVNHLFTPRGAFYFFVSLSLVKILHEFGHAFAARHYGLFVRRMGIAFMVFMPILYTDVTEAWKLPPRKARLFIGAGGMMVELCIAAVSLFFWSVLPDGFLRSIMFYTSGISLVSTVLMNLNPLMRFDGYYILMDYVRISNLRKRSTDMLGHYWRRFLVGWKGPKPEEHPWEQGMIVFGIFTIIYRFVIYFSITLMMYHLTTKLMGLIGLVMGALVMFILPFGMDLYKMFRDRDQWGGPLKVCRGVAFLLGIAGLLFIPVPRADTLPAFFLYENVAEVKSPGKGRLVGTLPDRGTRVERGDLLFRLGDEFMEHQLRSLVFDLKKAEASLENLGGGGEEGGYRNWLLAERQRLLAAIDKTRESLAQLEVRAPVSGRILEINEFLEEGSHVPKNAFLLMVGRDESFEIRAYAGESTYRKFKEEIIEEGRVFFKNLETPTDRARFRELLDFPVNRFPNEALFDFTGGPILAVSSEDGQVRSRLPYYPMLFTLAEMPGFLHHGTPCYVRIRRESYSIANGAFRRLFRIMAEEGFV
jgi:putative peptide zinc metalloprotease protein